MKAFFLFYIGGEETRTFKGQDSEVFIFVVIEITATMRKSTVGESNSEPGAEIFKGGGKWLRS